MYATKMCLGTVLANMHALRPGEMIAASTRIVELYVRRNCSTPLYCSQETRSPMFLSECPRNFVAILWRELLVHVPLVRLVREAPIIGCHLFACPESADPGTLR